MRTASTGTSSGVDVAEATRSHADPFASPKYGEIVAPPMREEVARSPQLIGALRLVDAGCSLLGFLIALPGAGGLVSSATLVVVMGLPIGTAAVVAGVSLAMIAFGCAIHFRQRWAIWVVLALAVLLAAVVVIGAIATLNFLPLVSILFLVPPIWLCLRILEAASEAESAGVPLSADIRRGRIEV